MRLSPLVCLLLALPARAETPTDLSALARSRGDFPGATIARDRATLSSSPWAFLRTKEPLADLSLSLSCTILELAKEHRFFGSSWSVWPDPTFGDQGYEVGVVLREQSRQGYRVQLSHRYQDLALVRYPAGGFLRVAPCKVRLAQAHKLAVRLQGNTIVVALDGEEKIRYVDELPALEKGLAGVGTSSRGKIEVRDLAVAALAPGERARAEAHVPKLSSRRWLGGRPWVFDGDEPILQLPVPEANGINNVKLRPGLRPLLSWNGNWDISNQGAYPDGANTISPVKVAGGGKTLTASWTAQQVKGRFGTRTALTVGFDARRRTWTYDVDSELEVSAAQGFHFRYGYDFEHHTPLDPFRWQYLVVRKRGGALVHRPVYPIDPGVIEGLQTSNGLRLWYGRHGEEMTVALAVEYHIPDAGKRKLSTAVCAAFYDTGVSFAQETAKPGTKVRVRYRYTGYPTAEAEQLFKESTVHDSPMLDPDHHYIFADEWPRITFRDFVPMSRTWIYGKRPFMTGHNRRPTYELARDTGVGSGYAMKLGPGAWGAATLATPADLPAGRYALVARCKADNVHGPGGRIELVVSSTKKGSASQKHVHYLGKGTFGWKTTGFAFTVPTRGASQTLGLGNAGTGEVLVGEVEFRPLADGEPLPAGVGAIASAAPARTVPAPAGAVADYRMEEGKGLHVYNHAAGSVPLGLLELSSVTWTTDEGRPALRFADNTARTRSYPRAGALDLGYLAHPAYRGRDTLPVALTGMHGGGYPLNAFTLASWIKPAERMGKAEHGGKGDVVGLGARRFILRLVGDRAPYRLSAAVNVNDVFTSAAPVAAGRWQHVALTGEPAGGKWRVRLYLDGKQVHEGTTAKADAPASIPPSLILGAEIFYFHDAYYRGLIGRTLVFERALSGEEVARLAGEKATSR
jgi:hypothetical protein